MVVDKHLHLPGRVMPLTTSMPNINYKVLREVCRAKPNVLAKKYGLTHVNTSDGGYWFKDNNAKVLAVFHEDSVLPFTHFDTAKLRHDTKIFCPTLDNRVGAYIILDYLQKAGLKYDILMTTGEEKRRSTARHFRTNKDYYWMFMFDRMGTGAVVYNYKDLLWELALDEAGIKIDTGSYSCIKSLEFLGCSGANFGVGMHDYHSMDSWISQRELWQQLRNFLTFYEYNANIMYAHEYVAPAVHHYPQQRKGTVKPGILEHIYPDKEKQERIAAWKADRAQKEKDQIIKEAKERDSKLFDMKRNFLLEPIDLLNIPRETAAKLYELDFGFIGEVAEQDPYKLVSRPKITKQDIEHIREALGKVGLGFYTNLLKEYNLTIQKVKKYPPEKEEPRSFDLSVSYQEETQKEISKLKVPQLDMKEVKYKKPLISKGVISYSIPLSRGNTSKLVPDGKGDMVWVFPLPQELVGFQASKKEILKV